MIQPNNPTKEERYKMLASALEESGRIEDFDNIIELLSPPPDITEIAEVGEFKDKKVGIIGGGLGGLSCAHELRKVGFDITIFEASKKRIGGRVYTYYFDEAKRLYGELGPMRVPVSHETTWHYIDKFRLNTRNYIQRNENTFIYVKDVRVRNKEENIMKYIYPKFYLTPWERRTPYSKILGYAFNEQIKKLDVELRKEILQIKKCYDERIQFFDSLTIRKAFEVLGFSEGVNDLVQCVSALDRGLFYNSYLEGLREEYPVNFSYLYEIVGGNVNLPLAIYNSLIDENPIGYCNIKDNLLGKVNYKRGHMVKGIYENKTNNKVTIKYQNKFNKNIFFNEFDYVVCAIPFSTLRNVEIYPQFSNKKMQSIRELNYNNSQKTLFNCNDRFWERKKYNIVGGGSYTDLVTTTIWYPSHNDNKCSKSCKNPGVLLSSYNIELDATRLGNLNDEIRIDLIKRQLELIHGLPINYLDNIVEDYKTIVWNNEENFLGAFCILRADQNTLFSYSNTLPEYDKKVYFAGEHISSTHAWMQGALKTGMEAANMLALNCKKRKSYKLLNNYKDNLN